MRHKSKRFMRHQQVKRGRCVRVGLMKESSAGLWEFVGTIWGKNRMRSESAVCSAAAGVTVSCLAQGAVPALSTSLAGDVALLKG